MNTLQHTAVHCIRVLQFIRMQSLRLRCSVRVLLLLEDILSRRHAQAIMSIPQSLQRTATHCNTLQHAATHCNCILKDMLEDQMSRVRDTLDTTSHCNTLQHTATHVCWTLSEDMLKNMPRGAHSAPDPLNTMHFATSRLQHTATPCNTLHQQIQIHCVFRQVNCSTLQHTATYCNILQHTATRCDTLQHTASHCITLQQLIQMHCLFQQVDCNTFVRVCRKYRFNTFEVCPSLLHCVALYCSLCLSKIPLQHLRGLHFSWLFLSFSLSRSR